MSRNNTNSDWDDENEDFETEDSNLVSNLRKQLREAKRERDELAETVSKLTVETRSTKLADLLKSKELSPKLAKFFPADDEVTPEAVDAWVKENADVFGISTKDDKADEQSAEIAAEAATYQRMTQTSESAGDTGDPAKFQDLAARIQSASSLEELQSILAGQ